jgi:hypothetical protein
MTTARDTNYATPTTRNAGRTYSVIGAVCAVLGIVVLPILLGPIGAVLGFVGYSKGDKPFGLWVGIGAIVTTVLGFALSLAVFASVH